MGKKEFIVSCIIVVGAIVVAYLINVILSSRAECIFTIFSKSEWFSFYATYTTGVFALIIGYLALSNGNRNSNLALQQHHATIIRQESNRIFSEITEEIKLQNLLFNVIEITSPLAINVQHDIPNMKAKCTNYRAQLNERQIQWGFIRSVYLNAESVSIPVNKYNECWVKASAKLDEYIKLQISLFDKIHDNDQILSTLNLEKKLLLNLTQMQSSHEEDKKLADEIIATNERISELENKQNIGKTDFEELVSSVHDSITELIACQESVYQSSILFVSELSQYVFIQNKDMQNHSSSKM